MKKMIIMLAVLLTIVGCNDGKESIVKNTGVITLAYEKPVDFKHFEVYVSLTPKFNPTGWNGSSWISEPNNPAEWNGTNKTLFFITTSVPIQVTGLIPGQTYYVRVVVVDTSGQRSIPSPEISAIAGDAQRAMTLVIAAHNASPAARVGADYICDGIDDQATFNEAINTFLTANPGATLTIMGTDGEYIITDSIVLKSNVILDIPGTIKVASGTSKSFEAIYADDEGGSLINVSIKNVTLIGNKNNVTGIIDGIHIQEGKFIYIDNVKISNFNANALSLLRCDTVVVSGLSRMTGSEVGIFVNESNNVKVSSCTVNDNETAGLRARGSTNIDVFEITAYGNGEGVSIYECNDSAVKNSRLHLNGQEGIRIEMSNKVTAMGNEVYNNSQLANAIYSNVKIEGSDNCVLQSNRISRGEQTNKPSYGIYIDNESSGNTVANNICYQSGILGGIKDFGINTNFGPGNQNNDGTWSTIPN